MDGMEQQGYGQWLAGEGARMEILTVLSRQRELVVTFKDPTDALQRKHQKWFPLPQPA